MSNEQLTMNTSATRSLPFGYPSTSRPVPFGYPSTSLRASAQGPRSRTAGRALRDREVEGQCRQLRG